MQLAFDQLDQHLKRGPHPLYVVHGDEPLLTLETVDRIRAAARQHGATERQVLQMEARSDWSQLTTQSASLSLFSEKRLLEIRLPSGKPGTQGSQALIKLAKATDSEQMAIVLLPKLDKSSKSSEWFSALVANGVSIEVPNIDRPALPRWIANRMSRYHQKASAEALEFISDKVEGNLMAAHQEIEKLALLYPAGLLSLEQVQNAVLNVARYGVQQLSDALLGADLARAVRIADGLKAEGEGLPLIVWKVADDVRTLIVFKAAIAAGRNPTSLRNELRLWGPREAQITAAARRINLSAMKQALLILEKVDRVSKGLTEGIGPQHPWELLLSSFSAFAPQPVPTLVPH
ncbi:MAG: DNA polymerase III subunit delta [Burkholderiaceae bacterium]|nr:DNA polymerase III subunit delta [Burkholderiaceae bacterium]